MIIHIDAFTYEDEWDTTMKELQLQIAEDLAEIEEMSDEEFDELDDYYDIIELDEPRMPTLFEAINDFRTNSQTLFILWLEDEETGVRKYIMKDTYEHCIGFIEGIRYCGEQTGVQLTPFMDFTTIRPGLLAAKTCVEVNKFFDCIVFDK